MITDGSLTPDCNFEVDYSNFDSNSITNEKELFEILKEFLWERSENDTETYLMLNLKIENKDGETFKQNLKENKNLIIPNPTKEMPFQLIHEHTLEDASYQFNYIDDKLPLDIEFQTYDNQKFLVDIKQNGKSCEYNFQGDGGTQDQFVTFRFLDKKGEIRSVRSSKFSNLPLELTEDNEEKYIQNVKEVAKNFFNKMS
jgi:phosphoribosylformylglycinamidine (FGAM) synthase PurS component|tara:strand:- start:96 stop:692 length:597 start_codon:yes stop_codon:yes gene_type:complete